MCSRKMKRFVGVFFFCAVCISCLTSFAAGDPFMSCGDGYILEKHAKIDGIEAAECVKLWCTDLENGKDMGNGSRANNGYKETAYPTELCDAENNCIQCFGERKWCAGEAVGVWNPEYGAYTRGGSDDSTYISYQKGSCFGWRLEKPTCPEGETAVFKNGQWTCAVSTGTTEGSRESSIRRTGTLRRIIR